MSVLIRLSVLAASLFAITPAAAEIPVAPLSDIYLSYNDCLAAATPKGLDPAVLTSLGWEKAKFTAGHDKSGNKPPIFFGNAKRKPLILLTAEKGDGLCIVLARLQTADTFNKFLEAWHGQLPAPDKDGTISFSDEKRLVQIRRTGTPEAPSLSMVVAPPSESR